jgi:hypothetical protein
VWVFATIRQSALKSDDGFAFARSPGAKLVEFGLRDFVLAPRRLVRTCVVPDEETALPLHNFKPYVANVAENQVLHSVPPNVKLSGGPLAGRPT